MAYRGAALLVLCAGCASVADELRPMPTAQVCYLGVTLQYEYRRAADEELKRRGEKCEDHRDEILAIHQRNIDLERSRPAGATMPIHLPTPGVPQR